MSAEAQHGEQCKVQVRRIKRLCQKTGLPQASMGKLHFAHDISQPDCPSHCQYSWERRDKPHKSLGQIPKTLAKGDPVHASWASACGIMWDSYGLIVLIRVLTVLKIEVYGIRIYS